jgi:hypothetical protein
VQFYAMCSKCNEYSVVVIDTADGSRLEECTTPGCDYRNPPREK